MKDKLKNITIEGPFWTARADIVDLLNPVSSNTLLYSETFNRHAEGMPLPGWRETKGNFNLGEEEGLFRINNIGGNRLVYGTTRSQANNIHSHYNGPGSEGWTNYTFSGRLKVSTANSKAGVTILSQYREGGADRYYRLGNSGANQTFKLERRSNANLGGNPSSPLQPQPDTWYRFEITVESGVIEIVEGNRPQNAEGTRIRAEIWEDIAGVSPKDIPADKKARLDAWDLSNDRLTMGTIGVWTAGTGTKFFDDFRVKGGGSSSTRALKGIFADDPAGLQDFNPTLLSSGTKVALCDVREVTVKLFTGTDQDLTWTRVDQWSPLPPGDQPLTAYLQESVYGGRLSLMVLRTANVQDNGESLSFICRNGHINLEKMTPAAGSGTRLFNALNLEEAGAEKRQGREKLPGRLAVHSSGLLIFGKTSLPWMGDQKLTAPFQLTRLFPDETAEAPSVFHLTLEEERLSAAESQTWIEAWRNLHTLVNSNGPQWVFLDFLDKGRAPALFWQLHQQPEAFDRRLLARRGAINIYLSDQEVDKQGISPGSLLQLTPEFIHIEPLSSGSEMVIRFATLPAATAGEEPPAGVPAMTFSFTPASTDRPASEKLLFSNLKLSHDPVETPRQLRSYLQIPTPEWAPPAPGQAPEPIAEPILWAFSPLETGWAQLPVINLTEQIYLDANLGNEQPPGQRQQPAFQGAVTFGNFISPDDSGEPPLEQPWDVSIINAGRVEGSVVLEAAGGAGIFRLKEIGLNLHEPDVTFNGLFWLSTGRPRIEDALPDLDDWINGLVSVPLKSLPEKEEDMLFPPPMIFTLSELHLSPRPSSDPAGTVPAQLGSWSFTYRPSPRTLTLMVERAVLPPNPLRDDLPLLWLRDPRLPSIQALPLTQSLSPANFPGASRQLAPFIFDGEDQDPPDQLFLPANWSFASAGTMGSQSWLLPTGSLRPAPEWQQLFDLPMVSLSLPGLVFDPATAILPPATNSLRRLPVQYRLDLPYADEVHAMAQLPKEPKDPKETSPLPDAPPVEPPKPLQRRNLPAHWRQLSNLANLASTDAADTLKNYLPAPENGPAPGPPSVEVHHLIEPLAWPVHYHLDLERYPGRLILWNKDEGNLDEVRDRPDISVDLTRKAALEGITGRFEQHPNGVIKRNEGSKSAMEVTANSMAAFATPDGFLRDQRGLNRAASLRSGNMLQTRSKLENGKGDDKTFHLTTLLSPLAIKAGDQSWNLWFKDVPLQDHQSRREFSRRTLFGSQVDDSDVNHADSLSREFNFLRGYEWRLGEAGSLDEKDFLNLMGLHFYPLAMENILQEGDGLTRIVISGRLQLPLGGSNQEQEGLSNVVKLTFSAAPEGEGFEFSGIEGSAGDLEWPMASGGSTGEMPRIIWNGIQLRENRLVLTGAKIRFFLFDTEWSIAIGSLDLSEVLGEKTIPDPSPATAAPDEAPQQLKPERFFLSLDLENAEHAHQLWIELDLSLGKKTRPSFDGKVRFQLVGATQRAVTFQQGRILANLELPEDTSAANGLPIVNYTDKALQFQWRELNNTGGFEFLPGMRLSADPGAHSGFTALTFDVLNQPGGLPSLPLRSAQMEMLIQCDWGNFLQDPGVQLNETTAFEACAGKLTIGITGEYHSGQWNETFLLNGYLEVKNLLSWPEQLAGILPDDLSITVPDVAISPVRHFRHSLRILLNQHQLSPAILVIPGEEGSQSLLFNISTWKAWQFLAVAEHQLLELDAEALIRGNGNRENLREFRWTALQEIRWLSPNKYGQLVTQLSNVSRKTANAPEPEAAAPYTFPLPTNLAIRGRVINNAGRPIPNMHVEPYRIMNGLASNIGLVLTDENGMFSLKVPNVSVRTGNKFLDIQFDVHTPQNRQLLDRQESPVWRADTIGRGEIILTVDFSTQPVKFIPDDFAETLLTEIDQLTHPVIFVEASAPHWVRLKSIGTPGFINLQFLPAGIQTAILSDPADFAPSDPEHPEWQLMTFPFLGRLQKAGLATSSPDAAGAVSALHLDPLFNLYKQLFKHSPRAQDQHFLVLGMTSTAGGGNLQLPLSAWDLPDLNRWPELDPQVLAENWFRLANPPEEPIPATLPSVTSALADTPARLSRERSMTQAFVNIRYCYPPRLPLVDDQHPLPLFGRTDRIIWREHSLIEFDFGSPVDIENAHLVWLYAGIGIQALARAADGTKAVQRFPAATLLPAPDPGQAAQSYVVSPYLGLGHLPVPGTDVQDGGARTAAAPLKIVSSELLCLDNKTGTLRPSASKLWELNIQGEGSSGTSLTEQNLPGFLEEWATGTHSRLSPESPLAILRLREIRQGNPADPQQGAVAVGYAFRWITPARPARLARRVFNLRTRVAGLSFREGQYGGSAMPSSPQPFELAPPLVSGVQPIYLDETTSAPAAAKTLAGSLPWGLSALRLRVNYTQNGHGVAGAIQNEPNNPRKALWWQGLQAFVQFRSAEEGRPQAGLPELFRARAIGNLLPALPKMPLPPQEDLGRAFEENGSRPQEKSLKNWQPILPGKITLLPVGLRPGVPFVFRHNLQRQASDASETLSSGSMPVQHRAPRPVSLPANTIAAKALRCWASFFLPGQEVHALNQPVDEAFFASGVRSDGLSVPNRGLQVILKSPAYGAIPLNWDGSFSLECIAKSDVPVAENFKWQAEAAIHWQGRQVKWDNIQISDKAEIKKLTLPKATPDDGPDHPQAILQSIIGQVPVGATLELSVRVRPLSDISGYYQNLRFPLRLTADRPTKLPLKPFFIHFEDPEYNRQLVSSAGNKTNTIQVGETPLSLRLSSDRKQYSPDSRLAIRFDWESDLSAVAMNDLLKAQVLAYRLALSRIDPASGVPEKIMMITSEQPAGINLKVASLLEFNLPDLLRQAPGGPVTLLNGDALQWKLEVVLKGPAPAAPAIVDAVELTLEIVEKPVIPVTESAYALLLAQDGDDQMQVSCPRFAWGPAAGRIELVNPDDLLTEIVRRRAVFQWSDTVRSSHQVRYGLQKIARNGSTHFVDLED